MKCTKVSATALIFDMADFDFPRAVQSLRDDLERNSEFTEILSVIQRNSAGRIWLVGGGVYRRLAHFLYDIPLARMDYDFIVQRTVEKFNLPTDWTVESNLFGNPKFLIDQTSIDYIPLENIDSIIQRGLEATVKNYLTGVPLTIQAIAYDLTERTVFGEVGIRALETRTVAINNQIRIEDAARRERTTIRQYILGKAESLGFTPILPGPNS